MSVLLASLVADLQVAVPARSDVPTTVQCERAIRDAVRDYSRRRPMQRITTLSIVSGTATYTLPTDFLFVIRLLRLWHPDGVLYSADGLVPVSAGYEERYTVTGQTLTLYPTPSYTATRELHYAAGHVLEAGGTYSFLTEGDVQILLLKAQASAIKLQAQAAAIAGEMVEYQIGDERVKRASAATSLATVAASLEAEYEAAVRAAIGSVGMPAAYTEAGT